MAQIVAFHHHARMRAYTYSIHYTYIIHYTYMYVARAVFVLVAFDLCTCGWKCSLFMLWSRANMLHSKSRKMHTKHELARPRNNTKYDTIVSYL